MHYLAGFWQGVRWLWCDNRPPAPDARHEGFFSRGQGKRWDAYKVGFGWATGYWEDV